MNPAIAGLPAGRPLGVTLPPSTGPLRLIDSLVHRLKSRIERATVQLMAQNVFKSNVERSEIFPVPSEQR